MSVRDMLLALCVVVIWGVNFVVIKVGLHGMPPLLLGALRFIFVVIPAIFFIPRPKIPLKGIVIYGLTISFAQFAFYSAQSIWECRLVLPPSFCNHRFSSAYY